MATGLSAGHSQGTSDPPSQSDPLSGEVPFGAEQGYETRSAEMEFFLSSQGYEARSAEREFSGAQWYEARSAELEFRGVHIDQARSAEEQFQKKLKS